MIPAELPATWRTRAADLRSYGAEAQAIALERAADELSDALTAADDEALTLAQAAQESNYSDRRLREMIADGTLRNVGRKGAPRLRRADLPRRATPKVRDSYDPAADAAAILSRGRT